MGAENECRELADFLARLPPGPITSAETLREVTQRLACAWDSLDGADMTSMDGFKLQGRMERVAWAPPNLEFVIERHGRTMNGSSRADLHRWRVNAEAATASYAEIGYRQIEPNAPRLNVKPMAADVARAIVEGRKDDRLKWLPDGSVRLLIGWVIDGDSACKQTVAGRRRRFKEALAIASGRLWSGVRSSQLRFRGAWPRRGASRGRGAVGCR